jgi:hypothetical protein
MASALLPKRGMTATSPVPQASVPSHPVLLWVFRRDFDAITCQVDVSASGCEVRVIPQWDLSLAVVERFDRAGDALRRHAEVSSTLREIGWTLADHVPLRPLAA